MLQFHAVTADERKRMASREAIIPSSDARAYGMVTARKPNGGRRYPRTRASEFTSDCVVTTTDGSRYTIKRGRMGNSKTTHRNLVAVADRINATPHRTTAADLTPIGNSNH